MGHGDTHRMLHELFNRKDFDGFDDHLAASFAYDDLPRGLSVTSDRRVQGLAARLVHPARGGPAGAPSRTISLCRSKLSRMRSCTCGAAGSRWLGPVERGNE